MKCQRGGEEQTKGEKDLSEEKRNQNRHNRRKETRTKNGKKMQKRKKEKGKKSTIRYNTERNRKRKQNIEEISKKKMEQVDGESFYSCKVVKFEEVRNA